MEEHVHYGINDRGRDFVVGDIHGCFHMLEKALQEIQFDEESDRLFSVGDLVDRGPLSDKVNEWLENPWFHPVRGNHEQMLMDYVAGQLDGNMYRANGGAWLIEKDEASRINYAAALEKLPIAITVMTSRGPVGLVHAECPRSSWEQMIIGLGSDKYLPEHCMWSRTKIKNEDQSLVEGVSHIFVGHTPLDRPVALGNTLYIDTGAFSTNGNLTVCSIDGRVSAVVPNEFWSG